MVSVGDKFRKLTVVKITKIGRKVEVFCKCDCGGEITTTEHHIKCGDKRSCGCLKPKPYNVGDVVNGMEYLGDTDKRTKDRGIIGIYRCHCGKIKEIDKSLVKRGRQVSCGCSRRSVKIGEKFNKLLVLEVIGSGVQGHIIVKCICDCGTVCEKLAAVIASGTSKDCGCQLKKRANIRRRIKKIKRVKKLRQLHIKRIKKRERIKERNGTSPFRRQVLKRDKFKCQICNNNRKLIAHHLDGFHWCVFGRNDVNNGVTLCNVCHKRFHKKYGRRNNIKEQFEEFKEMNKCQK